MKVLVIEDDVNKCVAITQFLSQYEDIKYDHKASYHSGMQTLLKGDFDLLLLDMSMPIYDVTPKETGGRPLALAGRDILFQLRRRKIALKAIVITQYEDFDGLSLNALHRELKEEFPQNYVGFVYYNITQEGWKDKLAELLDEQIRNGDERK